MTALKKGPTPLTDAAKVTNLGRMVMGRDDATYVPVEFAENLERDRARLVAALKEYDTAILPVASAIGASGQDVWPAVADATIAARNLLRDLGEL